MKIPRRLDLVLPALLALVPPKSSAVRGDAEHGRYLVEHVAMCSECHSPRDERGTLVDARRFMGAPIPIARPPWAGEWAEQAPRIGGLPGYDDARAMRLLTEGSIGRDGRALRRPMPTFRMTPEDAADVIAFLRGVRE
jgi:mono/diheme cytochrome c family protein